MNEHKLNYLYNGDCRELLKTYPDNFFDCFLKFLCARGCRCLHFVVDSCASRLPDFIRPEFRCISDVPYKIVTGGAGSTLIAAKETGRNYVGSEIDKKYYDIAISRLNGTAKRTGSTEQMNIFGSANGL